MYDLYNNKVIERLLTAMLKDMNTPIPVDTILQFTTHAHWFTN